MNPSFEYFSLRYLDMWLSHDRSCHESLQSGTRDEKLASLKDAAVHYKVARNLPKECDKDRGLSRYEPVLEVIDEVTASHFSEDTVRLINTIQKRISINYKNRSVLSLTTKFLWLKIRDPIIIYDSQARKALKTKNGDLLGFYDAWRKEYEVHSQTITTACTNLSRVSKYSCNQKIATVEYVKFISSQTWFQERVFDLYLWKLGQSY